MNKFKISVAMMCLNKALWLDATSHMTISNQSKCIISVWHTYVTKIQGNIDPEFNRDMALNKANKIKAIPLKLT